MEFDRDSLKEVLNPSQLAAVEYCDGASVIVAGAGSGKTRVLTYKVAYLIAQGLPASSILALTFTNKAAAEMKDRIKQLVGEKFAKYLWAGTFHSIFLRILRSEVEHIGFLPDPIVYDVQESKGVLKSIIKEMKLDEKVYNPTAIYNRISMMKNNLITPDVYRKNVEYMGTDHHSGKPHFIDIYEQYVSRFKAANIMDFDDILLHTYYLLKNNPEILEKYQQRFAFILVDEYQDTNIAQHRIISLLAAKHQRIAVVGDDAQSIYSFRGANIDNILHFQREFKGAKIFKLEENYRSTQTIVDAANSLIEKNRFQIPKKVFSNLPKGDRIRVWSCFTDRTEADQVVEEIERLISIGVEKNEIVILYRNNSQSRTFEDALRNKFIPYRILKGMSFYSRKEIKDVLAYMRLVINKLDEESLKRIINYPARGIGEKTISTLLDFARSQHMPAMDVIYNIDEQNIPLNAGAKNRLKKFGEMISTLYSFYLENDAYATAEKIVLESGLMQEFSSSDDPDNASRRDNIRELMSAIHEFCQQKVAFGDENPTLSDFLSEVSLLTDHDLSEEEASNAVTLMTIHSAKGLEFDSVFVVGVEEELLPSAMCTTEQDVEEERRLFYVAITRAKQRCYISYSKTRFRWGSILYPQPSRFLDDIDEEYLDLPDVFVQYDTHAADSSRVSFPSFSAQSSPRFEPKEPKVVEARFSINQEVPSRFKPLGRASQQSTQTKESCGGFSVGDRVLHQAFGEGTIMELSGEDASNYKALIAFQQAGEKTLLLKYAKLEKIS